MTCKKPRSAFSVTIMSLCCVTALLGLQTSGVAKAEIIGTATLTGADEVPPNDSNATGYATLDLDPDTGLFDLTLVVEGISLADLAEVGPNDTPVHIHSAPAGVNGGVVVDLGFQGTLYDAVDSFLLTVDGGNFGGPQGGVNSDIATNISDLLSGGLYINVHTQAVTGGEIRGQISATDLRVPEPATGAIGAIALVALCGFRYFARRD